MEMKTANEQLHNEAGQVRLTVLGCRGSMPAVREDCRLFGGNTSCFIVEAAGETLLLDAGTGILKAELPGSAPLRILLSHPHLDHILGLPMLPAMLQPGREIHIYGQTWGGLSLREQLNRLFGPPLWPARLEDYPASVFCHELAAPLSLGPFQVDSMPSCHPGGSLILKVSACGKSLVYATDFEHTPEGMAALARFARGTGLLLYDGQYTRRQFESRPGFGHSTAEAGLEVQKQSGARRLLLIHHDPGQTDDMLLQRERELSVRFAREGEVILL